MTSQPDNRIDLQVLIGDTAYGQVVRTLGADGRVTVNGQRVIVREPLSCPHVIVERLPRDIDTHGYG